MNSTAQTVAILFVLVGSYLWLNIPGLSYYSAQLAGLLGLIYFGIRFAKRKHYLPLSIEQSNPEFALISAAIVLLIGNTGNIDSFFFPFAYLHIFFLTMSLRPFQAIVVSVAIVFFHYSLITTSSTQHISQLLSLFLMQFIFLFTKKQYEAHIKGELIVEKQQVELSDQQSNAILFVTTFLKPKLENLLRLSDYPEENKEVIARQILIVQDAVEQLLEVVNKQGTNE
ncbi:MAG: hypothetical protein ABI425_03555 [Patescibacteria group bacterium]